MILYIFNKIDSCYILQFRRTMKRSLNSIFVLQSKDEVIRNIFITINIMNISQVWVEKCVLLRRANPYQTPESAAAQLLGS